MQNNLDSERRALTFDLYGGLLNFQLIPHFVGQVARERNISPELAEFYFSLYMDRMMYSQDFVTYRDLLAMVMKYLDMELNTNIFSPNANELYLLHNDLKPHHDVLPVLMSLRDKGYELFLMANSNIQLVQNYYDRLMGLFSDKTVLVADEVRCYMPKIDFFRFASTKFKLRSTDDHFHVASDYFRDIVPASRMQWLTAYINRSKTGEMKGAEPSVTLTNMTELEEGMTRAHQRILEEERAAQEREMAVARAKEEQIEAAERRKAAVQAAVQQQQMNQMHAQKQMFQKAGVHEGNQYFVPQNEKDRILSEKMRNMSPTKARALAKARERAIANARLREGGNGGF